MTAGFATCTWLITLLSQYFHLGAAKSLQSCPTLCDPIDGSPPGSPLPGILQQEFWSGLHFLLECMEVKSESEVAQSCPNPQQPHGLQSTRLLHLWDFPGKSTGVGVPLPSPSIWLAQLNSQIVCAWIFVSQCALGRLHTKTSYQCFSNKVILLVVTNQLWVQFYQDHFIEVCL